MNYWLTAHKITLMRLAGDVVRQTVREWEEGAYDAGTAVSRLRTVVACLRPHAADEECEAPTDEDIDRIIAEIEALIKELEAE